MLIGIAIYIGMMPNGVVPAPTPSFANTQWQLITTQWQLINTTWN
jgi:hypothetical protein